VFAEGAGPTLRHCLGSANQLCLDQAQLNQGTCTGACAGLARTRAVAAGPRSPPPRELPLILLLILSPPAPLLAPGLPERHAPHPPVSCAAGNYSSYALKKGDSCLRLASRSATYRFKT